MYAVFALVNFGPLILAGVPWLAGRLKGVVTLTLVVVAPLAVIWVQQIEERTDVSYHLSEYSKMIMPVDVLLVAVLGSSILRARRLPATIVRDRFTQVVAGLALVVVVAPLALDWMREHSHRQMQVRDAYFEIGGETLTLPMFTVVTVDPLDDSSLQEPVLSGKYFAAIFDHASDPARPLSVRVINLHKGGGNPQYLPEFERVLDCSEVGRTWERHLCRHERVGALTGLPIFMAFVARDHFDAFVQEKHKLGTISGFDSVAGMEFAVGIPELGCDGACCACSAIVALSPDLLAIWTVHAKDYPDLTERQIAARQADAIIKLARHGLDATEEFEELQNWAW